MSGQEQFLVATGDAARRAATTAGRRIGGEAPAAGMRRGIVLDVVGGLVTAGVVGVNGVVVDTIPGCPVWGASTPEIDDKILLAYEQDRAVPIVMAVGAGGGGGTLAGAFTGLANRFFTEEE